jgi:hypothetical protein
MQRAHRRWHLRIWTVMAVLLPAILITSAVLRWRQSVSGAPVRLDVPVGGPKR